MPVRILILQRGWVVVGRVASETENSVVLEGASIVRRWGTKNGLGEIAEGGPVKELTVLDKCGTLRTHPLGIVAQLDCDASKWDKHLG